MEGRVLASMAKQVSIQAVGTRSHGMSGESVFLHEEHPDRRGKLSPRCSQLVYQDLSGFCFAFDNFQATFPPCLVSLHGLGPGNEIAIALRQASL